ncbi:Oidioi.mRNA.OKI2018_I69.XSR.g15556.t1.cds [Oikopleura dioica]|uniref:Oidioi.mRNA.OKI2018_I69.XSR.g15556.t1.cds n=1 Tax=Oikopleura dioica TaxID=34765 RepID=A0ABN7SID3_OIKDI|nr:Oidioi.mRNA.OKI2018_I69.XSR.g15556.t1.cds [Oikopleura dioica]
MAKTGKGYDYETLDGKTRYSESKPSRTFLALNGVLFLLAFCAISRSFGHHARKEAGIYLPPPQQKMSYKEVLASFSPECPSSSSLSSVSWNLTSTEKPAFEFFAMKSHDLTILGPKSTLVQEFTEAMAAVLSEPTRERRHAAHHLDKLFYWTKTLSVFSQSEFLLPSIKDSQSSSIVSPDLFLRASSLTETLEIHYDESLEVPIFILRGGELWMSAVAGNGKLGVQALVQALLQAMEFGMKETG